QHSSNQLRALPRAQPRLRGSTPLAAGEAEVGLRLPDGDSQPLVTQGGAVEPTPPPQKSARRAMHTVQSHLPIFFKNMRGQPQISSHSLGGVGVDLGLDSLTMSGLVPDKFNSKHNLAGCVASWRACAVSPWVLKTITRGYVLQFAHPPLPFSGVIQSVDKHSSSRGGSVRLLQPILLGQIGRASL